MRVGARRAGAQRAEAWRVAAAGAGLLLVTLPWDSRTEAVSLLAAVPVLVWYTVLARTRRWGLGVGTVLTVLVPVRVLPMPAGLTVSEEHSCGSDSCSRVAVVTGDRADHRVRAHLAARGYRLRHDPGRQTGFAAGARHRSGVLIRNRVDLGYRASPDGTQVRLTWSVQR